MPPTKCLAYRFISDGRSSAATRQAVVQATAKLFAAKGRGPGRPGGVFHPPRLGRAVVAGTRASRSQGNRSSWQGSASAERHSTQIFPMFYQIFPEGKIRRIRGENPVSSPAGATGAHTVIASTPLSATMGPDER